MSLAGALAIVLGVGAALPPRSSGPPAETRTIYDGRAGHVDVRLPRIDTVADIDGRLDEPVWQRAALLTGFSEYKPVDGRPAADSTEVLVWYAEDAIYFGIRAFESHGPMVRSTLANRDNIDADDHVYLLLDTYDQHRQALVFAVNPLGVQEDGVWSDGTGATAGGTNAGSSAVSPTASSIDLNPDYVYQSSGFVTSWGYQVEIRIPFKSLHYQSGKSQAWGFQVERIVQHSGHAQTWTPAVRANAGFLTQEGTFTGIEDLHRGLVMDIVPEATYKLNGAPPATAPRAYGYQGATGLGGTVRWGVSSSLTAGATVLPDFSQVEADVGQVSANQRFALYYPEKRPFFLEGLELFNTPNALIYTRNVVQPDAGYKLIGDVGGTTVAYLGAVDTRDSTTGSHPIYNILRLRRNFGAGAPVTAGLVYSDRIDGGQSNRVLGGDFRYIWNPLWYSQAQVVQSWTRDSTGSHPGTLWDVVVADRTGRSYGNHMEVSGFSPSFEAASGFVNRVDYERINIGQRYSWYGAPGALIEQLTTRAGATPLWLYGDLDRGRESFEGAFTHSWAANMRGGWVVSIQANNAWQGWDPSTYAGFRVAQGTDTVPFVRPHTLYNLWSGTGSVSTPSRALYGTASLTVGATPVFTEASRGNEAVFQAEGVWSPTASLRFDALWAHQTIDRAADGSRAVTADIPRLKIEYQLTPAIFFRYVGQYTAQTTAAPRDPRTGAPLVIDSTVAAELGLGNARLFRQDILLAYQPVPGTALFLGYGTSLTEPNALQFNDLARQEDGFILKVSYLFRM